MKNKTPKEKWSYFWDYYKWHVIGGALLVAMAISLLHTFLSRKETAFYIAMFNMAPTVFAEDYLQTFADAADIDTKKYNLYFDTDMHFTPGSLDEMTMATSQKMMVFTAAGDLDAILADGDAMEQYAYTQVMLDLRKFLTQEELEKYQPYFYYADFELIRQAETSGGENVLLPEDPFDPASMTDPVPVGICTDSCLTFKNAYYDYDKSHYFCVIANSKRPELSRFFLDYIWEQP